jgi:hypothetical protein
MGKKDQPMWLDKPRPEDYRSAANFLSLYTDVKTANRLVQNLKDAKPTQRTAMDVLRASGLKILDKDDPRVELHLDEIDDGVPFPPVLLVANHPHLIIAAGYHRACATFHRKVEGVVRCHVVPWIG